MRIVHLVTIHADAGRAAAILVMAGLAVMLKERRIAWWVAPPADSGDIRIMGRVPKDLPDISMAELLAIYTLQPHEVPPTDDLEVDPSVLDQAASSQTL